MPSEPVEQQETVTADQTRIMGMKPRTAGLVVAGLILVVLIDIFAFLLVPPFDPAAPAQDCSIADSACLIDGTLHFPSPHVVWTASGEEASGGFFEISLTDTLFTMLLVTALLLIVMVLVSRGKAPVPGFFQNFVEWAYESLTGWGRGMGGSRAMPYIPIFAAFFVLILAFNWSGLVPPIGLVEGLRAPTSDLNVTIGLALAAFTFFQYRGIPPAWASAATCPSSSRSTSSGRASARDSSPCSWASSSSSSSSSSRSRCPSDSSATSTVVRWPWQSSPAWPSPSSPWPSTASRSS